MLELLKARFSEHRERHPNLEWSEVEHRLREDPASIAILQKMEDSAIPEAQEKISWSMPTYWKGANIIHFAASKKHIGLYPGDEAPVVFADQLAGYDVSKGTIRIPYISPLPKDLIANIARWCYEEYRK